MLPPRIEPSRAPSVGLPLSYLIAAALAFMAAVLGVPWLAGELAGHYYHPRIVALTHTVTLGWVTLTIMGASFQLIPIVLERRVWSERLAFWQLAILVPGIAGMVAHFSIGRRSGLVWAAGLVGLGVGVYLVNLSATLSGLARFTFTSRLMLVAFTGLALTVVFGIVLAADRVSRFLPGEFFPTLHAHFHLALLGWVMPMIVGVSTRAYPMFLLAAEPRGWPGSLQLWGLLLGVPGVVAGLLAAPILVVPGALGVAAAIAGHATWVGGMMKTRKRPTLDWGLRFVLTGVLFLLAAAGMGLAFAFDAIEGPRLGLAYAVLALGGWVSLTIIGMMLKIVPFLVWYRAYAPSVGRTPVPTLAGLSWPAAEGVAYTGLTTGTLALAATVALGEPAWIRAAGMVLALGAVALGAVLGRMLSHLVSPALPAGNPVSPQMGAR